jgi:hypothetical protein
VAGTVARAPIHWMRGRFRRRSSTLCYVHQQARSRGDPVHSTGLALPDRPDLLPGVLTFSHSAGQNTAIMVLGEKCS